MLVRVVGEVETTTNIFAESDIDLIFISKIYFEGKKKPIKKTFYLTTGLEPTLDEIEELLKDDGKLESMIIKRAKEFIKRRKEISTEEARRNAIIELVKSKGEIEVKFKMDKE